MIWQNRTIQFLVKPNPVKGQKLIIWTCPGLKEIGKNNLFIYFFWESRDLFICLFQMSEGRETKNMLFSLLLILLLRSVYIGKLLPAIWNVPHEFQVGLRLEVTYKHAIIQFYLNPASNRLKPRQISFLSRRFLKLTW